MGEVAREKREGEPVAVNLDTLKRVAKDFQLNEGMLKIVAQAMCFTDKQVAGLPNEAHIKVQGIRTGAEFAKYRAAAMELGLDKEALARARKCYESKKAKGGKEKEDAFFNHKGKKAKKGKKNRKKKAKKAKKQDEEELVLEIGSDGTFDFSAEVEEESESDDEEQPEQEKEQEKATAEEVEEAAEDVPVAEASEEVEKTPKGEWSRVQVEGSDSDSEDEEEKEEENPDFKPAEEIEMPEAPPTPEQEPPTTTNTTATTVPESPPPAPDTDWDALSAQFMDALKGNDNSNSANSDAASSPKAASAPAAASASEPQDKENSPPRVSAAAATNSNHGPSPKKIFKDEAAELQKKKAAELAAKEAAEAEKQKQQLLEAQEAEELKRAGPTSVPKHTLKCKEADKAIVVKIQLPGLGETHMDGVDLEVTANKLVLSALKCEARYLLELPLPQTVDSDSVAAKYNKKKSQLTVTLSTDLWRSAN